MTGPVYGVFDPTFLLHAAPIEVRIQYAFWLLSGDRPFFYKWEFRLAPG